jgi:hypothetical protein
MKKLTDAYVRTVASPEAGGIEVRDCETPGFALRVRANGAKAKLSTRSRRSVISSQKAIC